jgi:hypothetical protein
MENGILPDFSTARRRSMSGPSFRKWMMAECAHQVSSGAHRMRSFNSLDEPLSLQRTIFWEPHSLGGLFMRVKTPISATQGAQSALPSRRFPFRSWIDAIKFPEQTNLTDEFRTSYSSCCMWIRDSP